VGLYLDGGGLAETINHGGCLPPYLQWVKDLPLMLVIDGDADAYSASLGTDLGIEWTFESDTNAPHTLTAHREGLEVSASGQNSALTIDWWHRLSVEHFRTSREVTACLCADDCRHGNKNSLNGPNGQPLSSQARRR
jgi:hypothetical protein